MDKIKIVYLDELDEIMQAIYLHAKRECCMKCTVKLLAYEERNNCFVMERSNSAKISKQMAKELAKKFRKD